MRLTAMRVAFSFCTRNSEIALELDVYLVVVRSVVPSSIGKPGTKAYYNGSGRAFPCYTILTTALESTEPAGRATVAVY
jgi:hypothetical protein